MNWLRMHHDQVRHAIIGAVMIGLILFIWYGFGLYRQRRDTEAMIAGRNAQEDQLLRHATAGDKGTVVFQEDGSAVWNGKTYRRNNFVKAILCMGVDRSDEMTGTRELGYAGQADGVFLIAQDTARNGIRILMIPRDTMTEITECSPDGTELGKRINHLTLAYAYGDGREKSCENMVESTSGLLMGLQIDHYMAVDTSVIAMLNDAVGGVTVTVPTAGMEKSDPAFVKGKKVTLKGRQAEAFVRYRDITVDHSALYRMDQHQEYITQYFQAVKKASAKDSQIVLHLFDMIQNYMVTDMRKEEYLKVAMDALESGGLTSENFSTLPGAGVTTELYDEYHADEQGTVELVLNLFYREVTDDLQ